MEQSALLNSTCHFSSFALLPFPISEHEVPAQIKCVTFDHVMFVQYVVTYTSADCVWVFNCDGFVNATWTIVSSVTQFKNTDWPWRWMHYDCSKHHQSTQRNTPEELNFNTALRTWKLVVTAVLNCMHRGPVISWNVGVSVHERFILLKCLWYFEWLPWYVVKIDLRTILLNYEASNR